MLWYILLALAVIVIVLLIVIAMRPPTFRITRSATINAPPAVVFGMVNDFRNWLSWSPWEKLDPNLQRTHSGAPFGVGAVYAWTGNKKVGEGRMTILESRPNEFIRLKLEFLKPFKVTNTTEFVFNGAGNQTEVVWSMIGRNNFFFKAMGLFVSMEKMIAPDFERGLANMKNVAEGSAKSI